MAGFELTRPSDTNAYAVNDAIANSTTAASVVPLTFQMGYPEVNQGSAGNIISAQLVTSSASAFGAMRLWLFNRQPFAAAGYQADNAAIALTYQAMQRGANGTDPIGNLIGFIDFQTFTARTTSAISDGVCDFTELEYNCGPSSNTIYGVLEAMAIFTPASAQTFSVLLDVRAQ